MIRPESMRQISSYAPTTLHPIQIGAPLLLFGVQGQYHRNVLIIHFTVNLGRNLPDALLD